MVLDGITGMPDGIDRDAAGRIWVALFTHRGRLLTWIHAHAWVKPLVLRLPTRLLLAAPRRTGVLVLSPDGRTPLYSATYRGPLLTSVPSAVPAAGGVYLANLSLGGPRGPAGVVRLRWPAELRSHDHQETPMTARPKPSRPRRPIRAAGRHPAAHRADTDHPGAPRAAAAGARRREQRIAAGGPTPLDDIGTVHFARWVVLPDGGDGGQLLFASNFDGPGTTTSEDFAARSADSFDAIYSNCEGWPERGARDLEAFKAYIRNHELRADVYYRAYPRATVQQVRRPCGSGPQ